MSLTLGQGLTRRLWLLVPASIVMMLGAAQLVLDLAHLRPDPLLSDGFRLSLGSLVASIAVDRASVSARS